MNNYTKKLLLTIGPIVIESLLEEIMNDEKLTSFRDNLITIFRKTADETVTEPDDYLVEFVVDTIMAPGQFIEHTREVCGLLRGYVRDSQTQIDDLFVIPILSHIEKTGTTPVKA